MPLYRGQEEARPVATGLENADTISAVSRGCVVGRGAAPPWQTCLGSRRFQLLGNPRRLSLAVKRAPTRSGMKHGR